MPNCTSLAADGSRGTVRACTKVVPRTLFCRSPSLAAMSIRIARTETATSSISRILEFPHLVPVFGDDN
jgi:hypothetical protein